MSSNKWYWVARNVGVTTVALSENDEGYYFGEQSDEMTLFDSHDEARDVLRQYHLTHEESDEPEYAGYSVERGDTH